MSMIHDVTPRAPRNTKRTRKGRGEGSGKGKTAGRGTKGAKARVGTYVKRGHEHGQTPIFRRFPKRGFSNFDFANNFHVVNLADLNCFENGATVDAAVLIDAGLVPNAKCPVKILGQGTLTKKLTVVAGWYSKTAIKAIIDAGGKAQNQKGEAFEFPKVRRTKFHQKEQPKKKGGEAPAAAAAPAAEGAAPAAADQKPADPK